MQPGQSLIFVYNASSETLMKMNDSLMKPAASGSEHCNLHAVTFSPIGMKKEWKRFLHDLPIPSKFLSRNEFTSEFPSIQTNFPVAFLQTGNEFFILVSSDELNQCREPGDIINLVRQRLAGQGGNQT